MTSKTGPHDFAVAETRRRIPSLQYPLGLNLHELVVIARAI
jgi:hypothetical protein